MLYKNPSDRTDYPQVLDAYFAKEGKGKGIYNRLKKARLGDSVFVVVDTLNIQGRKVEISIYDKNEIIKNEIPFMQYEKINSESKYSFVKNTNGIFVSNVRNEEKDLRFAIFKLKLRNENDEENNIWKKKISKSNDKKLALYIKVTVEPSQGENIIYCGSNKKKEDGIEDNIWLGKDGKWFEVSLKFIAPWMEIAYEEEGVHENDMSYGFNRIKEYHKDGAGQNLNPKSNAWCASFANWVLVETNRKKDTSFSFIPRNSEPNNPALAINFVNKTRFPDSIIISPTKKPPYGSILIIQKKGSHEGHATFVINYIEEKDGFTVVGLGGNQFDAVQKLSYKFTKKNKEYIYNNKFILKGYVVPKEYKYDENDTEYYTYENITAPSTTGSNLR